MFPTRVISRSLSLALVFSYFTLLAFAQGFPTTVQVFMPGGGPPPGALRLSLLNRQEKFKEAVEVLAPLYDENHGMLEARLAYANALSGAGEIVKAEKIYQPILQLKDVPPATLAIVHFKMGYGLSRQGKFAEAVAAFDKAVALSPDLPNVHMHLGGALMQLQQGERAEKELLRAYELGGS